MVNVSLEDGILKIYTKTGDKGQTSLLSGDRVPKYNPRVEAYGTFDELNSWIGYIRSINLDEEVEERLAQLQPRIHVLCSDIASPYKDTETDEKGPRIRDGEEKWLEDEIDNMTADLEPLDHFILPGGSPAGAALHIARTVCRRGERRLVELNETEGEVNPHAIKFVNRLSDYLFTLARWANLRSGNVEERWGANKL
jgi:cob(I)alamin adenosyltransferase